MIRRTLAQIRTACARVSYVSGLPSSDAAVLTRINLAIEELMTEGDWPGVVDRYAFQLTTQNPDHIFLPFFLERILGVTFDDVPANLKSPWYEFVAPGPGPTFGCSWYTGVIDRDDSAIQSVFPPLASGPWNLFVETNSTPDILNVQGFDTDGLLVRTLNVAEWIDGENLDFSGTVGSVNWASITQVVKPATDQYVKLWATNGNTPENILLATYAPRETTPAYRTYFLPSQCLINRPTANCPVYVLVRARKRFVPLANDNDLSPISNLPALISMVQAVQKREVSDIEAATAYKVTAMQILMSEARSYLGRAKTPVLTFSRAGSVGAFQNYR
jgi:hypothetical protein